MEGYAHVLACVWRLEGNLQEVILSFHHVGSGDGARVVKLGIKRLSQEPLLQPSTAVFYLLNGRIKT